MEKSKMVTESLVVQGFLWKKLSKGQNLITKKGGTLIFTRDTSSIPNTHSWPTDRNPMNYMKIPRTKSVLLSVQECKYVPDLLFIDGAPQFYSVK